MALTLRQWRKAKEISQETIAEQLNIHVNTYINWEKNPRKISIENSQRLAKVLGVPVDEIIFDTPQEVPV